MNNFDRPFEPTSDPRTAIEGEGFEPINACRAAALGAAFGPEQPLVGLFQELEDLGLPRSLAEAGWNWREAEMRIDLEGIESSGEDRLSIFSRLSEAARPETAIAFLAALLSSPLERESAAAAAAIVGATGPSIFHGDWRRRWWRDSDLPTSYEPFLHYLFGPATPELGLGDPDEDTSNRWPWNGQRWQELTAEVLMQPRTLNGDIPLRVRLLGEWRLALAMRSDDPITRQFAMAPLAPFGRDDGDAQTGIAGRAPVPGALALSTVIHGTWGWKGDWWRPGATFHQYVRNEIRGNLYSRGAPFSWSGAYSDRQRHMAAEDFKRWVDEISPRGADTVLAHSYGGEIAVRAWSLGTKIHEVVLLSTPATKHVRCAVDQGLKTVDIRLPFDPVLALARKPQRIRRKAPNLTEVILPHWQLSHGATHDTDTWRAEGIVSRAGL